LPFLSKYEGLFYTWIGLRNIHVAVLVDGDDALAKILLVLISLEICQNMLNFVVSVFVPGNPSAIMVSLACTMV